MLRWVLSLRDKVGWAQCQPCSVPWRRKVRRVSLVLALPKPLGAAEVLLVLLEGGSACPPFLAARDVSLKPSECFLVLNLQINRVLFAALCSVHALLGLPREGSHSEPRLWQRAEATPGHLPALVALSVSQ